MDKERLNFEDTAVLSSFCKQSLENSKGADIVAIDVRDHSSITDMMIICSGTSTRHVASIADRLMEHFYQYGYKDAHISNKGDCQWVIVDAQNVIVHVMTDEARLHYGLEELYTCMQNIED